MRRAILVLIGAFAVAAILSYFGPYIAKALYGQDIVANSADAVSYVGTIVAIFSALFGAGAFFVVYEMQRSADRERHARVSAILLKSKLRFVLNKLMRTMVTALSNGFTREQLLQSTPVPRSTLKLSDDGIVKILRRWEEFSVELGIDIDTANSLSHLDAGKLKRWFAIVSSWEEIRHEAPVNGAPEDWHSGRIPDFIFSVATVLDQSLALNNELNDILLEKGANKHNPGSLRAWLRDTRALPV